MDGGADARVLVQQINDFEQTISLKGVSERQRQSIGFEWCDNQDPVIVRIPVGAAVVTDAGSFVPQWSPEQNNGGLLPVRIVGRRRPAKG